MVEWAGQFKWGSGSGAHINKYWVPLAEKEVENGNLKSFKSLGHSMGDEWNSVDLYVAENYATWSKAWDNMISGWRKNAPEEERQKHFSNLMAHKDNIYSVSEKDPLIHSKNAFFNRNGAQNQIIFTAKNNEVLDIKLKQVFTNIDKIIFSMKFDKLNTFVS